MSDFEKLINASDLIEWIMETYPDWCEGAVRSIVDHVEHLPSAQPEIIRCKDCKNYQTEWQPLSFDDGYYCAMVDTTMPYDGFCYMGERREDE